MKLQKLQSGLNLTEALNAARDIGYAHVMQVRSPNSVLSREGEQEKSLQDLGYNGFFAVGGLELTKVTKDDLGLEVRQIVPGPTVYVGPVYSTADESEVELETKVPTLA